MAIYGVHGGEEQVRVEGDNWLVALGRALPFFGLSPDALARLGVDMRPEGVVHVTDGQTGREFELRPAAEESSSPVRISLAELITSAPEAPEPAEEEPPVQEEPPAEEEAPAVEEAPADPGPGPTLELPRSSLAPEPEPEPEGFTEDTLDDPTDRPERDPSDLPPAQPLSFDDIENDPGALFAGVAPASHAPVDVDELLEDALMDIAGAFSVEDAAQEALGAAVQLVPCEAGAVLVAGINDVKLRFVAAHGPAAAKVRGRQIDLDTGVAGFCHRHGIGLVLHDVSGDTRHDRSVGRAVGFETRSMLSVALRADDGSVFGCIQLLNAPARFEGRHQDVTERLASALASYLSLRT